MSSWLAGIIGMCVGSALGILMISIVSVTRQKERENDIFREGFAEGHRIGLRKGKVLKIDAALYEELKGRVDVSPEQKIISKALVDEIVYGGPRRGGMMCELEGMRFKSAKIVGKDEEPRILSRDRVDKAPGPDSIRPEVKHDLP